MTTVYSVEDDEPLVVPPKVACRLLSVGETRLYELIADGELESFKDGVSRRITMASIKARVARKLEQSEQSKANSPPHRKQPARLDPPASGRRARVGNRLEPADAGRTAP
jgi:excisionase family DNA binding protein